MVLPISNRERNSRVEAAVAYARSRNVVVVAAAGNDGRKEPVYPAASQGVVAVTATDASGTVASFSNHGDWVDLAAPGMGIVTTVRRAGGHVPGGGRHLVRGADRGRRRALARAQDPAQDPWADAETIAARLRATAQDRGPHGVDDYYGAGVVDAGAALGGPVASPALEWDIDPFEPTTCPTGPAASPWGPRQRERSRPKVTPIGSPSTSPDRLPSRSPWFPRPSWTAAPGRWRLTSRRSIPTFGSWGNPRDGQPASPRT